jgi:hypothetical protein
MRQVKESVFGVLSVVLAFSMVFAVFTAAPAAASTPAAPSALTSGLFGWAGFTNAEIDSTITDARNLFGVTSSDEDLKRVLGSPMGPSLKAYVDWAKSGINAENPNTAYMNALIGIAEYLPSAFLGLDHSAMTADEWQDKFIETAIDRAKEKSFEVILEGLHQKTPDGTALAVLDRAQKQVLYISQLGLSAFSDRPYRQTFALYKDYRAQGMTADAAYAAVTDLQTQELMDNVAEMRDPCVNNIFGIAVCTLEQRQNHLPDARTQLASDLEITYFSVQLASDDKTQSMARDFIDGTVALIHDYENPPGTDVGLLAIQKSTNTITLINNGHGYLSDLRIDDPSGHALATAASLEPGSRLDIADTGGLSLFSDQATVKFSVSGVSIHRTAGQIRRGVWIDSIASTRTPDRAYDVSVNPIGSLGKAADVSWNFGDGTAATGTTNRHAYQCAGTYTLTATATVGSSTATRSTALTVPSPWTVEWATADGEYAAAADVPVSFAAHASIPRDTGLAVTWDFGDGTTGNGFEVTHQFHTTGYTMVRMTVTDPSGTCAASVQSHQMLIARSDEWITLPPVIDQNLTLSTKVAGYVVYNPGYGGGRPTTVMPGAKLTIPAGVRIKGAHGTDAWGWVQNPIVVKGELAVTGTAAVPIPWTSFRDNSLPGNPTGDGTDPAPGDYVGVIAESGSKVTMSHVTASYSASFIEARDGSAVTVDHLTVKRANGYVAGILNGWYTTGVIKTEGSARLQLTNSDLENVGSGFGIDTSDGRSVRIATTTLRGGAPGINIGGSKGPAISNVTFVGSAEPVKTTAAASGFSMNGSRLVNSLARITVQPGPVLPGTTRWAADLPYVINEYWHQPVDVPAASTLEIAPGTAIKGYHSSDYQGTHFTPLRVSGTLYIAGTPENPVRWTSLNDPTVVGASSFSQASPAAPGDWQGIDAQPGSHVDITALTAAYPAQLVTAAAGSTVSIQSSNVVHAYADTLDRSGEAVLQSQDAAAFDVSGTTISSDASGRPLVLLGGTSGTPAFTNVHFSGPITAIKLVGSTAPTFRNTTFTGVTTAVQATPDSSSFSMTGTTTSGGTAKIAIAPGQFAPGTTVWNADLPYELQPYSAITIPIGSTLQVMPGTKLKTYDPYQFSYCCNYGSFQVFGTLAVAGTAEQPVRWTSWRDASVGDTIPQDAAAGLTTSDWNGPYVGPGGTANLSNLQVTNTRDFLTAAPGSSVTIDSLKVSKSTTSMGLIRDQGATTFRLSRSTLDGEGSSALLFSGSANQPTIDSTTISGTWTAINVQAAPDLAIHNSRLLTTGAQISSSTTDQIDATGNWWGTPTGPDPARNYAPTGSRLTTDPWCLDEACTTLSDSVPKEFTEAPLPVIAGTTTTGETLTADPGTWDPAPMQFSYQWFRDGARIDGATTGTYTLTTTDAGTKLTVAVTGTRDGYTSQTRTSTPTAVITPAQLEFTNAPAPAIAGTTTTGETLTADPGTWDPAPMQFSYQWFRDGARIDGATTGTYTLTTTDAGTKLTVAVTGTRDGYTSQTRTSTPTAVITPAQLEFTNAPAPTITGTTTTGETLTADPGTWDPAPARFSYQWFRDGSPIDGASSPTYALTPADTGGSITVRATGSKDGYLSLARSSPPTSTIAPGTLNGPAPTLSGTVKVGYTLTANPGTWAPAPVQLTYQWFRGSSPVAGATSATYTLTGADSGASIAVHVSGSKNGYLLLTKASSPTLTVTPGILNGPTPALSGTVKVGYTLTANPGTWTSGTTLRYQWYRSGTPITGATAKTYRLSGADAGKRISTTVTGSLTGYTTLSRPSAATAAVALGTLSGPTPALSGTVKVGYTLTANPGTWTSGTTLRYQWYRSGTPLTGATAKTYRLSGADAGKRISTTVTGSLTGYTTLSRPSAATAAVALGTLSGPTPALSGTVKVGYTLTANPGTWTSGTTLRYQWYRSGTPITGATAKTYKLQARDRGTTVRVRVMGSAYGYSTLFKYSATSRTVG